MLIEKFNPENFKLPLRRISLIFLAIIAFFFSSSNSVFADVFNPRYFNSKCNSGEAEVECSYRSEKPYGPKIYNGCILYENNPNYRYLAGEGHSFGGSLKYCLKAELTITSIGYHIRSISLQLVFTLLLELPLLLLMIREEPRKKVLLTTISANLISIALFYLVTLFLPASGLLLLVVMELVVIIFETIFIKIFLKKVGFKKILIYSFVANLFSATVGSVLLKVVVAFTLGQLDTILDKLAMWLYNLLNINGNLTI